MNAFWLVDIDQERWRVTAHLGTVIDLEKLATLCHSLVDILSLLQYPVEL